MKDKVEMVIRLLIGLLLLNSGMNKFFQYMPMPEMSEEAMALITTLMHAKYMMPSIAIVEIIGGGLLIAGRAIPFALIILAPVAYNNFFLHLELDRARLMVGIFLVVSLGWIGCNRCDTFKTLFK